MQNVQSIERKPRRSDEMERELGITEARSDFGTLVERVQFQGDTYIINRHGKPAAAVVPVQVYESWKRQREELFELIREMQTDANLDPDKAASLATEVITVVRSRSQQMP